MNPDRGTAQLRLQHGIVLVAFLGLGLPALAQTIYRCGASYSQMPCQDAVALQLADPRTAAQKAQTDAATAQTTRLAQQLQRDRLAAEKTTRPVPRNAGQDGATKPPSTAAASPRLASADRKNAPPPEPFVATASVPKTGKPPGQSTSAAGAKVGTRPPAAAGSR